ncbi:MAG: HEPN domain-containing protein [Patescibacteria group bacterium]
MEQDKKILVSEWIKRAEDDELNALSILKHKDGTPAFVCFVSHQVAEKYLKALLLFYSGDAPKIHSLRKLIATIKHYSKEIEKEIKEEIIILDPYYIGARYPADIPLESFTWQMAEQANQMAIKIKQFVLEEIK